MIFPMDGQPFVLTECVYEFWCMLGESCLPADYAVNQDIARWDIGTAWISPLYWSWGMETIWCGAVKISLVRLETEAVIYRYSLTSSMNGPREW